MNTPNSPIKELNVRVKFFGPYRIMEWVDKKDRKNHRRFQRFLTYLNWHMPQGAKNGQKPYIRGTLIRSVTIRKLEEMFALFHRQFTDICPGEALFRDDGTSKHSEFIRHSERYVFGEKAPCNHGKRENACLFCQILGVFDNPGTEYDPKTIKKSVRFTNFKTDRTFNNIDELALLRSKNRYDKGSRKARDYFRVREADHHACFEFTGSIEINTDLVKNIDKVKYLLAAGLARINYLAGAPCRIDIGVEDNGTWDFTEHQDLLNKFKERFFRLPGPEDEKKDMPADDENDLPPPPASVDMTIPANKAKDAAGSIIEIVKKTNSQVHLRRLADAIRELRRKPVGELESLPEMKRETGKPSLWGLRVSSGSQSILATIRKKASGLSGQEYRIFFKSLGECLYKEAKKEKIIQPSPGRVLGENEYYGRPSEEDPGDQPLGADTLSPKMCKWIITGYLEAKSPFFFGMGPGMGQTDLQVLTDANGNLRLSFDLLRGVLRRDLATVLSGCNMEIGTSRPCDCPVCELISRCKFQDSLALDYRLPSETRQRIKIRPHTGTVQKGCLFNMEVGPEGVRFPFILRFRSNSSSIDKYLLSILGLWADGQCALGGNLGTGKGIFKLIGEKFFKISLESRHKKSPRENFYQLLQNRGFIGLEKEKLEEALVTAGFKDERSESSLIPPEKAAFIRVAYNLYLQSPVLTNDPVAAMFEQDTPDAVMFKKSRVIYNDEGTFDKIQEVYCLKAEGFRGPLRYLIGKKEDLHDLPHEDCDCFMCRIFGSNQVGGHIRFEDLELAEDRKVMRYDHVAIDWNGGGKEHAKYDDYPLAGSPEHELKFKGAFWVSNELDEDSKNAIRDAFVDLQDGMTTIGAKGSIGYGWVSRIKFHEDAPVWMHNFPVPVQEILSANTPESKGDGDNAIMLSPDRKYNPYYYLQPNSRVKRFDDLITHERYHKDKLSGKITCDLETLSPLFIPDTTNDRALDVNVDPEHTKLVAGFTTEEYASFLEKYPDVGEILGSIEPDEKGMIRLPLAKIKPEDILRIGDEAYGEIVKHTPHKSHRFFRTNEEVMLSGSGPRGMIASVYQMLTNSCFRNMDEGLYVTRRMEATEGGRIQSGVVTRDKQGNYFILEAKSYRLPLYDDVGTTAKIKGPVTNDIIAEHAKKNRDCLEVLFSKNESNRNRILEGREPVKFNLLTKKDGWTNGADKIAVLHKTGSHSGFIKFTGFNAGSKANQQDANIAYQKFDEKWDPWHLNILLNSDHTVPRPGKKGPQRPTLCCEANAYYTMTKRAERVFKITAKDYKSKELMDLGPKDGVFRISSRTRKQYEDIIEAYGHNTGKIVGNFRTQIINERLTDGDLVYFKSEGIYAENIVPVCISRKTDTAPLGKRFPKTCEGLRPCDGECLEDCETCYPECLSEYISRLPFELCPSCSLFGTTSFRGRVRFGFARLLNNDEAGNENKAKWYSSGGGYIEGDNGKPTTIKLLERPRATWPLPDRDATILGRKIYVNHPDGVEIDSVEPTENNATIEPLSAGNRFRFQVVFENLTKSELGNLIYSIELEHGMSHRLGRGKPLGLGSVKIDVKDILIRNAVGIWATGLDKQACIEAGKTELAIWFEASSWDEIRHIQVLRKLLRTPIGDQGLICYPGLEEHKALKKKWSSISEFQARLITPWEAWSRNNLSEAAKLNAENLEKLLRVEEADSKAFHPVSGQKAELIQNKHMKDSKKLTGERYGTVKWFNETKGFGFIKDDGGDEVFVHHTKILIEGFRKLAEGQRVNYDVIKTEKGLQAENVMVVD